MPNLIKSATTISNGTIKRNNFLIGVNTSLDYGPTSSTGFWSGIVPPAGGYTVYAQKESQGPSIRVASTDTELIAIARQYGGTGINTVNDALNFFNGQSQYIVTNIDYGNIVTSGLTLMLDAGYIPSYPKNGTSWSDLSGNNNNGALTNGPTYSSADGGSIVFDGIDDTTTFTGNTFNYSPGVSGSVSLEIWVYPTGPFTSYVAEPPTTNLGGFLGQGYFNNSVGWGLGMYATSTTRYFAFQVRNMGTVVQSTSENLAFNLNTWYHVVGSFNRSDFSRVYVNGNLITSASSNSLSALTITPDRNDARVGSGGGAPFYSGCRMSVARIYNRALSTQEVQQNYEASGKNYVSFDIQYLVVAGGGAGGAGNYPSGGGGAGGLLTGYSISLTTNTSYSITVGAGGSASNGSNSKFNTDTAIGGGRGGSGRSGGGASGGSGGGGATNFPADVGVGNFTPAGNGTIGQGNSGGVGKSIYGDTLNNGIPTGAGGGGGAGAIGNTGTTTPFAKAGDGGIGLYFSEYTSIGGSPVGWFAGGGGGSTSYSNSSINGIGLGGNGGGGKGSYTSFSAGPSATAGTVNTGGGGGGTGYVESTGVNGGSGVVILRIPSAYVANFSSGVSATMTWIGSYKYYQVTATSTISETVTFS